MKQLHKRAKDYFEGKNFMTPYVLETDFIGRWVYELSEGTGLRRQPLFGVTVKHAETGETSHKLSTCFDSKAQARSHIKKLEKEVNE
jgi:hypothetical protein